LVSDLVVTCTDEGEYIYISIDPFTVVEVIKLRILYFMICNVTFVCENYI